MDVFRHRIDNFIYDTWKAFAHKAGNEVIPVNNEASMRLNYAYLLKKHLDFIIYDKKEKIDIALEYTQLVNRQPSPIDILLRTSNGKETLHIPIKLKCYCQAARAGANSGSYDIFKQEVYAGLEILERYATLPHFVQGYALIMTNVKSLVYASTQQSAKQEDFSISKGHEIKDGIHMTNSSGGKDSTITLKKSYRFEWHQHGSFWFSLIQGI